MPRIFHPHSPDALLQHQACMLDYSGNTSMIYRERKNYPHKYFFEDHTLPAKMEKKISNLIKKQQLIYGSDASVNDNFRGSFAWGIMDKRNDNNMFIQCK